MSDSQDQEVFVPQLCSSQPFEEVPSLNNGFARRRSFCAADMQPFEEVPSLTIAETSFGVIVIS
jgi:hypothetical protein